MPEIMPEIIINPIGEPQIDGAINNYITIATAKWIEIEEKIPWWKFWKRKSVTKITKFILGALDELIPYVDQLNISGPDKKATVLAAVAVLYDCVMREALPIWGTLFSGKIKYFLIYVMLSSAIDWIVEKYRKGVWDKKSNGEIAALWSQEAVMLLVKK